MTYPRKNPRNQLRGAQNKAQGGHFEKMVDASCLHYADCGLAEIEKTPEPFKVTRRISDFQFQGHFEKAAQPDYKGTLKGGSSIVFDAKHTDGDRIKYDRITEHQRKALNSHHAMGARCFVLVSLQFRVFAFIPWEVWTQMQRRFKHLYMNERDLAPYRVEYNGRIVQFLKGVV